MDGTCDPELLCTREYVRAISITGHYVGMPLSPHLQPDGMEKHAHLLKANLASSALFTTDKSRERRRPGPVRAALLK